MARELRYVLLYNDPCHPWYPKDTRHARVPEASVVHCRLPHQIYVGNRTPHYGIRALCILVLVRIFSVKIAVR